MEGRWEHLLQEARKWNEMVVFSELEHLVQMARFATEQIPPHPEMNWINESPDIVTTYEPGDRDDSTPESNGDKNGVFHTQGAVATIHSGERDNIGEECGTDKPIQIKPENTIHSSSIMDPVKLDKDEQNGLKCLAESLENLRGHMTTAWNSAMV